MVFTGRSAQARIDHAASEAAVFHGHEAVHHSHFAQQICVHEVRLRIAGDIADLQVQVFAGGINAVGRVHAVDLEQVLIRAGPVEGNVFHIHRAAVR
ncbi:hypothetical protein D3C72_870690 [compost metagenome]